MTPLNVLFIDDSDLDVMLAVRSLRGAGYVVRYERVQREADLVARLDGDWDVIICDHQMPEFDALSALRLHRETGSETPFLIVSGVMPDAVVIDAMREGARDFIHKDSLIRLVPAIERELRDVRDRRLLRQAQDSVDRLLNCDLLTGLGNLDALMQRVGADCSAGRPFSLLLVELHRFSRTTRGLGMVAANRILRLVALRIDELIDSGGLACRIGADRFALVLPGAPDAHRVLAVGQAIHEALQQPVVIDGQEIVVAPTVRAACHPDHGRHPDAVLRAAEAALEAARQPGPGRSALFESGMGLHERESLVLERALHGALAGGEFVLHFQPQVDLASRRPVGAEALLRWASPQRGLLVPGDFLPLLEDSGLILAVGKWVIVDALNRFREWQQQGLGIECMTINLSALQFQQPDLVDWLATLLAGTGVDPAGIELEIAEGVATGSEEQAVATLTALRQLGFRLAIDDFGAGYSSLAYLQHFPVHRLKIDRSFVRHETGAGGFAIARSILALAGNLGLDTLAEGVETAEQAAILEACGCRRAQGFLFSRPLTADACAGFFRQWP